MKAKSAPPKKEATSNFQFMKIYKTSLTAGKEKALPYLDFLEEF
jgi:hypothetical protein